MSEEKIYTLQECQKHSDEKDCWLIIRDKVYDVTSFLEEHPGGFDVILSVAGKNATTAFQEVGHSKTAKKLLESFYIGELEGSGIPVEEAKPEVIEVVKKEMTFYQRLFHVFLPFFILFVALCINFSLKTEK
uniref:Cytochrome b5 heme-binding domain-containing protein n=1 Tax=Polytomella parva TaxID=51329 RepID=A0A7S0UNK8_9CHLO|mmetsp:Transcript_10072/g.18664  ORF Transcript_10072/g.18664 Transcript_10072/m.18664 type:complete len:132 (+) Transcript_10072:28-423(+)